MRGKRRIVVMLFAVMAGTGQAAEMTLNFGMMPGWNSGVTLGTSLRFPQAVTSFLTPELTLAYWSVEGPNRDYSPVPGEYEPPYFHWGHRYDGPWDAVATGVRLNLENAWPLLPKFLACGVGIAQLAAWKSDDTVHDNTYGVMMGSGFVRIDVPTAPHHALFLEVDLHGKLFGHEEFPDGYGVAKLGFRFGV